MKEGIPDAGKRLDRLVGQRSDHGLIVAEPAGQKPTGMEVIIGVRRARDFTILFADLLPQRIGIHG